MGRKYIQLQAYEHNNKISQMAFFCDWNKSFVCHYQAVMTLTNSLFIYLFCLRLYLLYLIK